MHIKALPSLEMSLPSLRSQKMKLLLYFLLFITVSNHSVSASSSSHNLSLRRQASILVTLKQSFQTENTSFDSWNLSNYSFLCVWPGVQCDTTTRSSLMIVSLDISNSNISGSLSPAITRLRSLASLDVSGNEFAGEFPAGIHALAKLKHLNLSNNLFAGEMSWEFSELRELVTLDAYNNNFNGSLPRSLAGLGKLRYLSLGGNFFSGEIPRSYGLMSGLEYLSLAGNDLGGAIPGELGNLTRLKQLYLGYYNAFDGGIPAEFGKLLSLSHLDIANCSLKGPIPPELGNLKKLDTLFLQTNELNGSLPARLRNLSSLKSLDISNNALSGEIPAEFSELKELTLLNLFINKFHGEIPRGIAELPKLEVLKLWQNNFTGTIPPRLGMNGMLAELDLSTNKLTGTIPKSLCSGGKLRILILLNNFLFGPLPEDLGRCDMLVRVRMGHNYLAGDLPRGFLYLPEMLLLELHNNYLTGELEQASTKMAASKLSYINLSNNRLSGPIPRSLGDFSSLQIVLLSGNGFTAAIPPEIGRLKSLLKADLSKNRLSGHIPSSISNCLVLTYLDLSQNEISGEIPARIAEIHNLNYLNISWNNLTGAPPREIGSMKSLTSADFSHNNLSGSVPETGQYSFFNSTSFAGNPHLCVSPACSKNATSASPESTSQTNQSPDHNHVVLAKYKLIFALGLLLCSLLFAAFAIARSRRNKGSGSTAGQWKLTAFQKLGFTSRDVVECVKDGNVIGRGGAGVVYSGTIGMSGERVAVKKLLGISNNKISSSHHDNGLKAEIQTLGKIRHRNIVRLLAFCSDGETNLLVYEYMDNGSLGEVLHGKAGGSLKWETRLDIAVEAAKGISYLHHDCSPLILHRDVKSNNILLDSTFEAHVADFGLAKFLHDTGNSECMSAIAGSYGYIAPEYAYTLKVDEKSDVYSFGVVLLELISGRKPVGDFGEEGLDIVQWAKMKSDSVKEGVAKILDERLFNDVPVEQAMQVFFVAMLCVQEQSVERPAMREVVQMLAQAKQPSTFHMQ